MIDIGSSPWSFSSHKDGAGFGLDVQFFGIKVPNVKNIRIVPEYGLLTKASAINGMLLTKTEFKEKWWTMTLEILLHEDDKEADVPKIYDSIKDEVHERLMVRIIELEEENASLKRKKKK